MLILAFMCGAVVGCSIAIVALALCITVKTADGDL